MEDWNSQNLATFLSPVHPSLFVPLAFGTILAGVLFASLLFIYELNASKSVPRSLVYEFGLATPASLFMGFGIVMLFSAIGIHV